MLVPKWDLIANIDIEQWKKMFKKFDSKQRIKIWKIDQISETFVLESYNFVSEENLLKSNKFRKIKLCRSVKQQFYILFIKFDL